MSRNTTASSRDWITRLGFRTGRQYDTLADIKPLKADDILNINFDDISGRIEEYSKETILQSEQINALQCLLLQKANYETAKKTAAKSPKAKHDLIMLGLSDRYDINVCKRRLEKRREGKRATEKEVNAITDMLAAEKLKGMPPAPDEEIHISKNEEGGRRTRTRTRTRRRARKSHKRHKKRSTRRRR